MLSALRLSIGGLVTLWIAYTLYAVARYGGAVVVDFDTTSRIMSVRNSGEISSAIGLTYHGMTGAALVVLEFLVVLGALVLGLFARGRSGRLARVVLAVWTALWFGNAFWLRSVGWSRTTDLVLMGVALLAALAWIALPRATPRATTGR